MDTVFTQGPPEDRFALLDALFARAPVGLAFLDHDLRYRRVNAALAAINGAAIEDHIGRTPGEVLGEVGDRLAPTLRRLLETGEPVNDLEVTAETPATPGELRSWRISLYPVADADGHTRGVGAVVVESTPERRATADAEAARALLDVVFDSAPVGMAFWDRELRYVRINRAATEINALSAEEHLGRRVDDVLGEPLGRRIATLLQDVLESGQPVIGLELAGDRPGRPGEPHHREVNYFPLPGPDGTIVGVGAVAQDVTARRRLDELRERLLQREHEGRLEAEAARRRAEFVAAAGDALNASLEWEQTVRAAVDVAVPTMADLCVLHLLTPDGGLRLVAVAHGDPQLEALAGDLAGRFGPKLSEAYGVEEAIRTGRTVTAFEVPEARLDAVAVGPEHREGLRALAPRSLLVVPVTAGSRRLGALVFLYTTSGRRYREEDVLPAEALADQVALALENARLHTERSRIAQTLQRSLLPPDLPVVPGIEAAAGYYPSGDENEVGGDFYDLFESEPGVWTVLMGDVAGKGVEAAALTALARYTLRTASMLDTRPAHNLRLLNDALLARDAGTCTVLYARLCPHERSGDEREARGRSGATLTAAAAGHPPPYVVRAGGELEELTPAGTLLGAVEAPRLQTRAVELGPGDLVLFYTDGATDVRVAGGVLGDGPLREELAASRGGSAQDVVERIADRVRAVQGGRLDDDLALLALRVR